MTEARDDIHDTEPAARPQSVIALTAIVLSVCALFVSVLEVSSIRSEQRMGVWPYVDVSTSYNAEGFTVSATNKGIGPARVRFMSMSLDDQPVDDLDTMIQGILGPERAFSYDVYRASNPTGSVLSPDERTTLFGVPWTDDSRALVEELGSFSLSLCYCSVYDDCWVARMNQGDPEPVSSCPSSR